MDRSSFFNREKKSTKNPIKIPTPDISDRIIIVKYYCEIYFHMIQ